MKIIEDENFSSSRNSIPCPQYPKIGIVGPCSSGKTSLVEGLKKNDYHAVHIAQEHSYVPHMWQHISKPDILIFLDVSFPISQQRRSLNWNISDFEDQQKRLAHARQHANLTVKTDDRSISEILTIVIAYLNEWITEKGN